MQNLRLKINLYTEVISGLLVQTECRTESLFLYFQMESKREIQQGYHTLRILKDSESKIWR